MPGARIKGSVLREFMLWYEQSRGLEVIADRLTALPESERAGLDPQRAVFGILASRWYPMEMAQLLLDIVTEGMSELERHEMAREGSRAATTRATRGVYKVVFDRLVTPERYARNIPRLWRMLHDTGDRRIEIVRPGKAISTIENWEGHHELMCRITVETMAALLEKMGCQDVDCVQTMCVSWKDPRCETVVRWRP